MTEFKDVIERSVSEFSHLFVEGYGREVSGKDYTDLHYFLEDVRDKYDGRFVFRFRDYEGEHKFKIELATLGGQGFPDEMPLKRLIRAILYDKQDTFKEFWIENGRLFLRGDFPPDNREICFYGMDLYTIKITDNGDQIRGYVPLRINQKSLRDFRVAQILRRLNCLECSSDGDNIGFKKFSCQNCELSIELADLDFTLSRSMDNIIRSIEEDYT